MIVISNKEVEEEMPDVVVVAEPAICSSPIVVDETPLPEVSVPQVPIPQVPASVHDIPIPTLVPKAPAPEVIALEPTWPKKHAWAMYMVAHTAAVIVIGAAAMWSVLGLCLTRTVCLFV